jgi:two-component system response regulator PilR (NtrC family)
MQVFASYAGRIRMLRKVVAFCSAIIVTGQLFLEQIPLSMVDMWWLYALYVLTTALCLSPYTRIRTWGAELSLIINTCAMFLTGLHESFFVVLYLPLLMLIATQVSERRAIATGIVTFAVYALLVLAGYQGDLVACVVHLVGIGSGFILVSFAAHYMFEQSRDTCEALSYKVQEIQTLLSEREQLMKRLQEVEGSLSVQAEFDDARTQYDSKNHEMCGLVGASPAIQRVRELMFRAAPTDATVLITGPSGTGKEVVAKGIHRLGTRADNALVVVNCGAIPADLLESQLFGHKKGSFTGAVADHIGLFMEAHKGTIFLDEIGELPLLLQAKLLRVLQERIVRPVGGTKDIPIDVRIIAATNRNLKQEVQAGRFREDLYYRLNVIGIELPSLVQRREDIPMLVHAILSRQFAGADVPTLPVEMMNRLMQYGYPGNVRELENILERAIVFGDDGIVLENQSPVPSPRSAPQSTEILTVSSVTFPVNLEEILASIESSYMHRALAHAGGVKKKAAELLGLNFRSFRYRYDKLSNQSRKDSDDNSKYSNAPFPYASIE